MIRSSPCNEVRKALAREIDSSRVFAPKGKIDVELGLKVEFRNSATHQRSVQMHAPGSTEASFQQRTGSIMESRLIPAALPPQTLARQHPASRRRGGRPVFPKDTSLIQIAFEIPGDRLGRRQVDLRQPGGEHAALEIGLVGELTRDFEGFGEESLCLVDLPHLKTALGHFAQLVQSIALVGRNSGLLHGPIQQRQLPLALRFRNPFGQLCQGGRSRRRVCDRFGHRGGLFRITFGENPTRLRPRAVVARPRCLEFHGFQFLEHARRVGGRQRFQEAVLR